MNGGVQQPRKPLQLASVGVGVPPKPLPQDTALKFESLQPGMVVSAQVSGVLADGLRVVFCGYFEGTISCESFGVATVDWPKLFAPGTKVSPPNLER